jgi:hypothetical protein
MTTGFELSNKTLPFVIEAIGKIPLKHFLDVNIAPIERDKNEATDLVLKLTGGDIAVRIRQFKYSYKYDKSPLAFDWSIRFRSKYGNKTEIDKLREGYAKWYFFGIVNEGETSLFDYCIIDMDKVRSINLLDESNWQLNPNKDGTIGGYMKMRKVDTLDCIIARSNYEKNMDQN